MLTCFHTHFTVEGSCSTCALCQAPPSFPLWAGRVGPRPGLSLFSAPEDYLLYRSFSKEDFSTAEQQPTRWVRKGNTAKSVGPSYTGEYNPCRFLTLPCITEYSGMITRVVGAMCRVLVHVYEHKWFPTALRSLLSLIICYCKAT